MLLDLLNYTLYADKIVIDTFAQAGKSMPEAERLFSHVLNAQHIWVKRILNEKPDYATFDMQHVEDFQVMHLNNAKGLLYIYHNHDLTAPVIYANSQGQEFVNAVHDILFHVVNHSTYHRAQIAAQFSLNNIKPPVTDYILLKREGEF